MNQTINQSVLLNKSIILNSHHDCNT